MNRLSTTLVLIVLVALGPAAFGQRNVVRPEAEAQQKRPGARVPMIQLIQGMYINQLQQQTEINDEQFGKVVPLLRQFIATQYELGAARRTRAQNQLQQAIRNGASDEELSRLIEQYDEIEVQTQTNVQNFFTDVDPILSVRQQARLRVFLVLMDRRIRNLIQEAQNPVPRGNQPRRGPATPEKPQS
jgi:hypothetical protein